MSLAHFQFPAQPAADPAAIVSAPRVRFTVLTSRLLRLEYDPAERFEDRPSQVVWHRQQPVPKFSLTFNGDNLELETEHLLLRYRISDKGFSPRTLNVHVKATSRAWKYGDPLWKSENLMGTARTLDGASGGVHLEPGLLARSGWAVVDDARSLVFDAQGWLTPRAPGTQDLYFFGHGHAYRAALRDFHAVAGRPGLLPRWALGNWWSRYWAYSADELRALVDEFAEQQVPLAVCIVDMDWHLTRTGNDSSGWTGYTWNHDLFPDPRGFIEWLHARGLRTALNLHPAEGIHPHEAQYAAMAAALGRDPAAGDPIPFDLADPVFARAYFDLLHHPREAEGVDFWWIDWQQGQQTRLPGLDPLWWLNHLHFLDLARDGRKRPFIFSRWGGLGNHRYPIGFSGDTIVAWESLAFQPGFTATASNVGYGWWSHDIGGHMGGVEDDELYTRWVQYGVFSPILRLHSTKTDFHERRPWGRGPAAARHAADALRLRHQLIPYLYTMAWRDHAHAQPLIQPLYYSHPAEADAYNCPQQYWFGSELIAAPFLTPRDADTRLSRQAVWLPDGDWFHFFTGQPSPGGWHTVYGDLDAVPVFARAGAIVPLATQPAGPANPEALTVIVFPGADNAFALYEDDGVTTDYQRGHAAQTELRLAWQPDTLQFTIAPVQGDAAVVPARRAWHVSVRGIAQPARLEVRVNGTLQAVGHRYDAEQETLTLDPVALTPADTLAVTVAAGPGARLVAPRDRRAETVRTYLRAFRLDAWLKHRLATDLPHLLAGRQSLRSYTGLKDAQLGALEAAVRGP